MTPHHPVTARLRETALFRPFEPAEIDEILELAEPSRVSAGRNIVSQGDSGHSMFVLAGGEAAAVVGEIDGVELPVMSFHSGDVFGELALLDGRPHSSDVVAVTDCTVLRISTSLLRLLALAHPRTAFKLAMAVLDLVGRRLHGPHPDDGAPLRVVPAPSMHEPAAEKRVA
jgi:CRP-like cAMP-binding protein